MRGLAMVLLALLLIGLSRGEAQLTSESVKLAANVSFRPNRPVPVNHGKPTKSMALSDPTDPSSRSALVPNAIGDGATDNCSSITSAIGATVPNETVALTFGPGVFYSSCSISSSGHSVSIRGSGRSATELRFGNTDGLVIAIAGEQTVDLSDMMVTTTAVVANKGIAITYTPAGFAEREPTRVNLNSLVVKGVSPVRQSWNTGISLTETNAVLVNSVDIIGTDGPSGTAGQSEAENTVTPYGLVLAGNQFPTDIKISNGVFKSLKYGIYADTTNLEGLQISQSTFLLNGHAIHWVTGSNNQGRPQLLALGNHFNVYSSAVEATGISESTITKNLIYHNEGSTSEATLISLSGTGSVSIIDNEFENFLAGPNPGTTGISVAVADGYPVPASYLTTIAQNMFGAQSKYFTIGVSLTKGVASQFLAQNRFAGSVAMAISDASDAGFGQQTAYGRNIISLKLAKPMNIPNNKPTAVAWDTQVYRTPGWVFSSGAPTRITVAANRPFAQARCSGHVQWASSTTGVRLASIIRDGAAAAGMASNSINSPIGDGLAQEQDAGIMPITRVAGGDYFELLVTQTSGRLLPLDEQYTWFQCESVE